MCIYFEICAQALQWYYKRGFPSTGRGMRNFIILHALAIVFHYSLYHWKLTWASESQHWELLLGPALMLLCCKTTCNLHPVNFPDTSLAFRLFDFQIWSYLTSSVGTSPSSKPRRWRTLDDSPPWRLSKKNSRCSFKSERHIPSLSLWGSEISITS